MCIITLWEILLHRAGCSATDLFLHSHNPHCAVYLCGTFSLSSFLFAFSGKFNTHRKVSKWTFPIWLYVSLRGLGLFYAQDFWVDLWEHLKARALVNVVALYIRYHFVTALLLLMTIPALAQGDGQRYLSGMVLNSPPTSRDSLRGGVTAERVVGFDVLPFAGSRGYENRRFPG